MKRLLSSLLLLATLFSQGLAQAPAAAAAATKPTFIKGQLNIAFNTRTQLDGGKPRAGATDVYSMSINVCDSAVFRGTITQLPFISNTLSSNQRGQLVYSLDCDVVNPANPSQTRNVGRIYGNVPVDEKNAFRFSDGFVKIAVLGIGQAKGFESRFNGLALGKPPAASGFAKAKQDTLRLVSGKGGAVTLKRYDIMSFQGHVIAAGPVQLYPESTVAGDMVFDYDRNVWYFRGTTISYVVEGRRMVDTLTGSIRWVEAPNRKSTGEGAYTFDVRVNEPPPSEAAVFGGSTDESAFFQSDDSIPTITGTVAYKDTITSNDIVTASAVQIDLKGSRLNKVQVMNVAKLLFLSAIVPLNAE